MSKNRYEVKTRVGTFTRSTDRTYTHIIVVIDTDETMKKRRRTVAEYGVFAWAGRPDLAVAKFNEVKGMRYFTEAQEKEYLRTGSLYRNGRKMKAEGAAIFAEVLLIDVTTGEEVSPAAAIAGGR